MADSLPFCSIDPGDARCHRVEPAFPEGLFPTTLFALSIALFAGSGRAQQFPYQVTPNYNWGAGGPYGLNYNYDYMRLRAAGRGRFSLGSDRPGAA